MQRQRVLVEFGQGQEHVDDFVGHAQRCMDLRAHHGRIDRAAGLGNRQLLELVGALLERFGVAPHRFGALLHGQSAPVPRIKALPRAADGPVDLSGGNAGDFCHDRFVGRIFDNEAGTFAAHEIAVDIAGMSQDTPPVEFDISNNNSYYMQLAL